jgi:hypothetical protein
VASLARVYMQQHTVAAINIKTVTHESTNDLFYRLILKNKLGIF